MRYEPLVGEKLKSVNYSSGGDTFATEEIRQRACMEWKKLGRQLWWNQNLLECGESGESYETSPALSPPEES